MAGPPGPGHVTTGLGSLDMTKRNRDLARRDTGALTSGSGGTVVDRVVPAYLACRIGARARAGERDAWPAVTTECPTSAASPRTSAIR